MKVAQLATISPAARNLVSFRVLCFAGNVLNADCTFAHARFCNLAAERVHTELKEALSRMRENLISVLLVNYLSAVGTLSFSMSKLCDRKQSPVYISAGRSASDSSFRFVVLRDEGNSRLWLSHGC